eukprot:3738507-Alexandrium_andersonii.AAC.1
MGCARSQMAGALGARTDCRVTDYSGYQEASYQASRVCHSAGTYVGATRVKSMRQPCHCGRFA